MLRTKLLRCVGPKRAVYGGQQTREAGVPGLHRTADLAVAAGPVAASNVDLSGLHRAIAGNDDGGGVAGIDHDRASTNDHLAIAAVGQRARHRHSRRRLGGLPDDLSVVAVDK